MKHVNKIQVMFVTFSISAFYLTHLRSSCILELSKQDRRGEAFRTPPGSKENNGKEVFSGAADSLLGHFCLSHIIAK